jgi:hypothetical protein
MKLIVPKVIGNLTIRTMKYGNLAVVNNVKNSTNGICIPCRSYEDGEDIIEKIKGAKAGDMIFVESI